MKLLPTAALLIVLTTSLASAEGLKNTTCSVIECEAGSKSITYATKQEPYYACGTRELVEYTNFILGLMVVQAQLVGRPPNISDKTGEPEYQGETKSMLDALRGRAGVSTFDQAVSMCTKGVGKLNVTVLNNPKDSNAIYVMTNKNKTFWLPKSSLDKK
jgi:hypothetical protein